MLKLLQKEGRIGQVSILNRVVMPAMGVNLAAHDGSVTDDIIAFYESRARGGTGLIITEVTRIADGAGISDPCQLSSYRAGDIAGLQRIVESVHKYGTRIFIQLQHPGREASPVFTGEQPVAPSAIANPSTGIMPRELSYAECRNLVEAFVNSAYITKLAGADGVELHAAHGYLLNEFLSPAMNTRTDRYGGSFDNRMRFVQEIITGIRSICGNYPISVRINAEESLPGGIDLQEAARIAFAFESAGADAINVSCYTASCIEPGTYEEGCKRYMAHAIKQAVSIPIISVSNIKEPQMGEQLLSEGVCDFVGVGRAQLADCEWCAKAFSGRASEIRRCIGCLTCFDEIVKARRIKCAVNPKTGREREFSQLTKDGGGRKVVVVGGGPAGIEAALILKARHFAPVLCDDKPRLGGTLNVADKGYGKRKLTHYVESSLVQVDKAGIELSLDEKATPESVADMDPCGVFVACGAVPICPDIPGIGAKQVLMAEDVLFGHRKLEGNVVVVGSGLTGLETAEMLAMDGSKVTLVDMLDAPGAGVFPSVVADIMERITPYEPRILMKHRLNRVLPAVVELTSLSDGELVTVASDYVVLAMGVKPRREEVERFKSAFEEVIVIGDARLPGRILEATQDALGKAFVFNPESNKVS